MSSPILLPDIPETGVSVPSSLLINESLGYLKGVSSPAIANHVIRSVFWTLITVKKHPDFRNKNLDLEAVVYAIIMHDLGWIKEFQSEDRRFEVDSANESIYFLEKNAGKNEWDQHRTQLVWDIIALHATESIALHKQPEVACAFLGISQDFFPPGIPGRFVTMEEHMAVMKHFPRGAMESDITDILCSLCRDKPQTTYDNFVGSFGLVYGIDGQGESKEDYKKGFEHALMAPKLVQSMKELTEMEQQHKQ